MPEKHFHHHNHLALQLPPVRVGSLQLPRHVLLELLHVEQLHRLVQLKRSAGNLDTYQFGKESLAAVIWKNSLLHFERAHLQNFVCHRILSVSTFDVDVCFGDPLDQDVPAVVHLDLAALQTLGITFGI